ncbi:leucine-rich repeat-containing protein 9-like isoform X2 [Ischnura elegans]|uniref:leucine-rich repeat-containing protein 9-like isoform X2 n=1 Tax=Ischnura elegans TaxID=197161 RepID=UPI001ED8AAAB|nr:leucine-rich repeat-containing protein 9-like isoform X2 [Ischnura elegans]
MNMLSADDNRYGYFSSQSEFYSFFEKVDSLINFPQHSRFITKLIIIKQPISSLAGLQNMHQLKELWVAECSLKKIECLEGCTNMEKLYLYSNKISKIQGLDNLEELQTLSLSGNEINEIMNINHLRELRELYLSDNYIREIGRALTMNKKLKILNISGNPLFNLTEAVHLSSLESLSFADPVFKVCPLTYLCNYRIFMISQLNNLKVLDSLSVLEEERSRAQEFIKKKKIFYSMRKNQIDHHYYKDKFENLNDKHAAMIKFKDVIYNLKVEEIQVGVEKNCLELQGVGNIFLKKITPKNHEAPGFRELMDAFFCKDIFSALKISSIKINDVTAIFNKSFRSMQSFLNMSSKRKKPNKYYIMQGENRPKDEYRWLVSILESGFFYCKESPDVTNCLGISDGNWLEEVKKKYDLTLSHNIIYKGVQRTILIVKSHPENLLARNGEGGYLRHQKKQCPGCCKTFKVKNPDNVIPAFIIEYEYIYEDSNPTRGLQSQNLKQQFPEKKCKVHDSTITLDGSGLKKKVPENIWNNVTKLSLPGQGIGSIEKLPLLPNINAIDLSFNKLTSMSGLESFPNLVDLDASHNNMCTVADMVVLQSLQILDLSWNNLGRFTPILRTLKRTAFSLQQLEISFNPISDTMSFDHMAIFAKDHLPQLHQLNGHPTASNLRVVKTWKDVGPIKNLDLQDMKGDKTLTTHWKCDQLCNMVGGIDTITAECNDHPVCVYWRNRGIHSVECHEELKQLKWANLNNNFLMNIEFLKQSTLLEELSLSNNILQSIDETLNHFKNLVKLDLSSNYLNSIFLLTKASLPSLKILNISVNQLTNLSGTEACPSLSELYAYYNYFESYDALNSLKYCKELKILDLSSNKIVKDSNFMKFIVFYIPSVEIVNGHCVNKGDVYEANLIFGSSLDQDYLLRKYQMEDTKNITQLTLSQCCLKLVNLSSTILPNLKSLDLSYNSLISFWGIHNLPKLEVLSLSHNKVACIWTENDLKNDKIGLPHNNEVEIPGKFPNLQILHLDHNDIQSLSNLRLHLIPKLHTVFLQNNYLPSIKGLTETSNIRNLILDRNNIKAISTLEVDKLPHIQELYLESNKISELTFLMSLTKVQRLFLSLNKISDIEQLKFISYTNHLKEMTLFGNPITRNPNVYPTIVQQSQSLKLIDGCTISLEGMI